MELTQHTAQEHPVMPRTFSGKLLILVHLNPWKGEKEKEIQDPPKWPLTGVLQPPIEALCRTC